MRRRSVSSANRSIRAKRPISGFAAHQRLRRWASCCAASEVASLSTPDEDQSSSGLPEPLTHRNSDGVVYVRAPAVERQISEILALPPERVAARVAVAESNSSDYLSEECLV